MRLARSGHAIVFLKEKIYVLGGFTDDKDFTNTCESYDL